VFFFRFLFFADNEHLRSPTAECRSLDDEEIVGLRVDIVDSVVVAAAVAGAEG
jgi:hypothetical protein